MVSSKLNMNLLQSPLEQFDSAQWSILTFQSNSSLALKFSIFDLSTDVLGLNEMFSVSLFTQILLVVLTAATLFLRLLSLTGDFAETFFVTELGTTYVSNKTIGYTLTENFGSLLVFATFFGSSVDEEDAVLESEGDDLVNELIAPIFLENLGRKPRDNGGLFTNIAALFSFVFFCNVSGMVPYSDTPTSALILTFFLAVGVFLTINVIMVRKNGIEYFFSLFLPSGAPIALILLLIPIEFISYCFRAVSLAVRLFANMMAGHTLFKVLIGFSWTLFMLGDVFLIVALLPIVVLFILTFLEIGIAIVQAYIFTVLTCMYFKDVFQAH